MMMNSHTQQKKGAAFVRFQNAHAAEAAVAALDGLMFSGSPRPISVSIAQENGAAQGQKRSWSSAAAATIASMGQQAVGALSVVGKGHGKFGRSNGPPVVTKEGTKLFVGQLPFSRNESGIAEVFSKFGEVAEVYIHRDAAGQKKGGAFVRFFEPEHAAAALEMDGFVFEGATRPISVIFAGAEGGSKRQRAE
jgi:RNA recognition motif-containing protein